MSGMCVFVCACVCVLYVAGAYPVPQLCLQQHSFRHEAGEVVEPRDQRSQVRRTLLPLLAVPRLMQQLRRPHPLVLSKVEARELTRHLGAVCLQ